MGKKKSTIKTRDIPKTAVARNKTKSQGNDSLLIELRAEEMPPK